MKKKPPTKFVKGPNVMSFDAFLKFLDHGYWFYLYNQHRAYHPRWVANMNLGVLRYQVANGLVHLAIVNPEYKEKKNGHTPLEVAAG